MKTNPTPWRYEPCGDSDGFTAGTDHFVLDADGNEIACPPCDDTARKMAAAPDLHNALVTLPIIRLGETLEQFRERFSKWYREVRNPAVDKAEGR